MAKIQLRQKKRFSAIGAKPVKKAVEKLDEKSAPIVEEKATSEEKDVTEETPKVAQNEPESTVTTDTEPTQPPVNTAASYKQTMVPNSVRKRLRAEKRANKTGSVAPVAVESEPVAEETAPELPEKRLGNLFNLGAQNQDEQIDSKLEIMKPKAIGEEERVVTQTPAVAQTQEDTVAQTSAKNRSKNREFENLANLEEFSVDAFTQESERLKAEGKLDEYKRPMTAIGGGKHQITSLLRQAQDNKEQLEASYSQQRVNAKESGAKYGF